MSRSLLLGCEAISKAYGSQSLFTGLSFGLHEKDRVGVVGPNGSGKSTFLRILAGIEEPDSGIRSARRMLRIGYVQQDPTFPPELTVEGIINAALGDQVTDTSERARLIAVTLGRAGFTDFHQSVNALSGGWKKRLAIACELVRTPDVLPPALVSPTRRRMARASSRAAMGSVSSARRERI